VTDGAASLFGEGMMDEISDSEDSEEQEFDDGEWRRKSFFSFFFFLFFFYHNVEGVVDEDDRRFERYVIEIPAIATINEEKEEVQAERFVDFGVLIMDSESGSDEGGDMDLGEDEEVVGGDEEGGAEGGEGDEQEIDGVSFVYRQGSGAGRRSIASVIESLQAKAGRRAFGYDEEDEFIDDEDLENDGKSNSSLLGLRTHVYSYQDFRMSTDWDPPKVKLDGGSSRAVKKALKPLNTLTPPATEELRGAIEAFRSVAKPMQENMKIAAEGKKNFKLPEELSAPLRALGKAIEQWHPRSFLIRDIFDYVADLVPCDSKSLKNRARQLLGPATPRDGFSQQTDAAPIVMPMNVEEQSASRAAPLMSRSNLAADDERLVQLKVKIDQALQEQSEYMHKTHPPDEKHSLRFKFSEEILSDIEAIRTSVTGAASASFLYNEIVSWFPEPFMDTKRIQSKLSQHRKKMSGGGSSKKRKVVLSTDNNNNSNLTPEIILD
jgi:hypothetical protein